MGDVLIVLSTGVPAAKVVAALGPWLLLPSLLVGGARVVYRALL